MSIAVTGASGFVGGDLVRELREGGYDVVSLGRSAVHSSAPGVESRFYDLTLPADPRLLDGVDVLIHCAFERHTARNQSASRANVTGTLTLFDLARARNVLFVYLSSLSAVPYAPSSYGRHKFYLETQLTGTEAVVIRPGLVVGDGGLVRAVYETMRRFHVLPLVDGGEQPIQCVGVRDLSTMMRMLVERNERGCFVTVAGNVPITARRLAFDIRRRFGLRALRLSLRSSLVGPVVALLESCGVEPPITTENLLGLRNASVQPVTDVCKAFGIELKPWDELLATLEFATR